MPRWKDVLACVGAAALGGAAVAMIMGAAQNRSDRSGTFRIVEAESFILRDRHGVARGRFEWRSDTDQAHISLMDNKGVKHVSSVLNPDGAVSLTLGGNDDIGQIVITRAKDGETAFTVSRKESVIGLLSHANGEAEFILDDQLRTRRASLGIKDDGMPSLKLMNADGRVSYRAASRE